MRTEDLRIWEYIGPVQGTFGIYSGQARFVELKDPSRFITSYCHVGKWGYVSMKELEGPPALLEGGLSSSEDEA